MTKYRIYYNNSQDLQPWSVDEGTPASEITVIGIELQGVHAVARTLYRAGTEHEVRAWLEVESADLTVVGGVAILRAEKKKKQKHVRGTEP